MKLFIFALSASLATALTDELWDTTNKNNDNYLDPDEFRKAKNFSNRFISGFFGKYDANEDGLISLEEY